MKVTVVTSSGRYPMELTSIPRRGEWVGINGCEHKVKKVVYKQNTTEIICH